MLPSKLACAFHLTPCSEQGRNLVLLKHINLLLPWGYLGFPVCSPQGCKDVWWRGAKSGMVKRRLEEFQGECFCSRAHFQWPNWHQRLLLRDAFQSSTEMQKAFAGLHRNSNRAAMDDNEAIQLFWVYESEKCFPCLSRRWFCFLAFEKPQLLTLRAEI